MVQVRVKDPTTSAEPDVQIAAAAARSFDRRFDDSSLALHLGARPKESPGVLRSCRRTSPERALRPTCLIAEPGSLPLPKSDATLRLNPYLFEICSFPHRFLASFAWAGTTSTEDGRASYRPRPPFDPS